MCLESRRSWMWVGLLAMALTGCAPSRPTPPNQADPMWSPSKKYVLTVPIEQNPKFPAVRVWKMTIADEFGNIIYKDDDSEFVGTLNVYWWWDADDRVWLYNSDDGWVWYWEFVDEKWVKSRWDKEAHTLTPPIEVYPHYARPTETKD